MIEVSRLNGSIYFLNPDLILTLEATPDTVITLTTGEKLMVRESPQELIDRFVAFKRRIVSELPEVKAQTPLTSTISE
ncbi:flagellar FlbD family protein [Vampirovibrio chlorellavorus]|uniref:flagellar FlbD family protein n=1 Tax=Vampirovibrio chlorellavorus TaxID=758823 RepID=UPI0026F1AA92|nr:flagellar FlbD family protein [Vampirovibrio chlorellavorus]